MPLYLSTLAPDLPAADSVAALKAEGFTHLCAVGGPEALARVAEPPLLWCLALHDPHLNFASDDRSRWDYSLALARQAITVAGGQGAPMLTLPGAFAVYGGLDAQGQPDSGKVKRPEAQLRWLRALDQLANLADNARVQLSIRLQALLGREELLTTPEEADALLRPIGAPHLRLGLDLGHVKLSSRILQRDPDDLVEGCLTLSNLVWLHGNEGQIDTHSRPKASSWEASQLDRAEIKALPLVYDARHQPLAELRAVANWLSDEKGYSL